MSWQLLGVLSWVGRRIPEVSGGVMTLDWVSKACHNDRDIYCPENSLIESTNGCDALHS